MKTIGGMLVLTALAGCGAAEDYSIVALGRENSSGSYTYFKEHVLAGEDFSSEVETLPGTAALVSAVMQDPRAMGYGGIAYMSGVRALRVKKDPASPAIAPSQESVQKGTYPLSRSLYFYTLGEPEGLARAFIDWSRGTEGQKICSDVGYFPLPTPGAAGASDAPPTGKQTLTIKGSDTMKILTSRWAEKYAQLHPDCTIQCVGGGSENGIKALREGEVQICQSSRPLKPAEMDEIAAKRGKKPVEFAVALDGLAVFVNEKNPVQEISLAELKSIYTGKMKRWGELTHPAH